jgi:hypothetical protein
MSEILHNDRRALRISHILTWCRDWSSEAEGLIDLLADARHWCDRHGADFAALDRVAYRHYLHELNNPHPTKGE